jgi:hypothetical protein
LESQTGAGDRVVTQAYVVVPPEELPDDPPEDDELLEDAVQRPWLQVSPVAVQSVHAAPNVPHAVSLLDMHVPFWQQPFRHDRPPQPPPVPPDELADDPPEEPPDDELLDEDPPLVHDPPWHV